MIKAYENSFFKPMNMLNLEQRSSRCPSSAWEIWHLPRRCGKGTRRSEGAAGTPLPNLVGRGWNHPAGSGMMVGGGQASGGKTGG